MGVELLDCTLRDGGYVNNWEFGRHAMVSILDKLDRAGIEIIECGFLTSRPRDGDCSLFGGPEGVLPLLPQRERRAMYVAMIAMGEKELPPGRLPPRGKEGIQGIRLTFHREEADRAFAWAGAIMDKGYQVFLQPVGTAFYSDLELLRLVERVDPAKALRLLYCGHPGQHVPEPVGPAVPPAGRKPGSPRRNWGITATTTCSWPFPTLRP